MLPFLVTTTDKPVTPKPIVQYAPRQLKALRLHPNAQDLNSIISSDDEPESTPAQANEPRTADNIGKDTDDSEEDGDYIPSAEDQDSDTHDSMSEDTVKLDESCSPFG
jgi:hypothetical protein